MFKLVMFTIVGFPLAMLAMCGAYFTLTVSEVAVAADASESAAIVSTETDLSTRSTASGAHPGWITEQDLVIKKQDLPELLRRPDAIPTTFVVASGRWSTPVEAMTEARSVATQLISGKMASHYVGQYDSSLIVKELPELDRLIQEQSSSTYTVELIDGIEVDMSRAFVKIRVGPEHLTAIAPHLRSRLVQQRMLYGGGTLALCVVCAGGLAFLLERKTTPTS